MLDNNNQMLWMVKGSGGGGLGDRLRAVVVVLICALATDRGIVVG